ncbi:terminase large subunit [Paenibacillus contaminans]|uniref:Phage terminase large subunit C-terminal domain-containing protein n=1 Tax=Paenibacillus contaminans TaxID=450362 RepID=A0A329MRS5_9BACL|nr:terminase large subunit [Paenibacillus contaminans]RAV22669.1 hypothetical protein DQG23_00160 [Paenibacillus contaminans]
MSVNVLERYKPHPKQKLFHKSKARFKNLCAGVRAGKTFSAARETYQKIEYDVKHKKKKYLVYWLVAPTHVIGLVQRKEFFKVLTEPYGLDPDNIKKSPLVKSWNANDKELTLVFRWKSGNKKFKKKVKINFKTAKDPSALVGESVDGAWLDEASRMKEEAWSMIQQRISDSIGWVLLSTTPLGRNWYYEQVYLVGEPGNERHDPDFENFVFYTADNTAVPGLAEEVQRRKKTMPFKYWKRDYMASFDSFEGQIYDDFNRDVHLVPRQEINKMIKGRKFLGFIMGKDWGYVDAGTSVVIGVTEDFSFYVVDLLYEEEMYVDSSDDSVRTWVKEDIKLFNKYQIEAMYCDTARAEYIAAYRKYGFPIKPVDKTRKDGVQLISTLFHVSEETGKARLYISEDLTPMIKEVEAYKWAETKDGRKLEEPEDGNDHTLDALRYAIYNFCKSNNLLRDIAIPRSKETRGW